MNKPRLGRRQLLLYFGMGIAATSSIALLKGTGTNHNPIETPAQAASGQKMLPEFRGISQWLNSAPLTTANLKGKVVLIQFWTLGCINCQRTLPYIVKWHQQYKAQGLQVIGVHTPEFGYERDINNVKRAIKEHQITYPVPLDNEFKTWNAYNNQYWPNLYLVDRKGFIQYTHSGEGAYDTTEQTIQKFLA
jgi:thiol-disulfide isomerase/thioredoxin